MGIDAVNRSGLSEFDKLSAEQLNGVVELLPLVVDACAGDPTGDRKHVQFNGHIAWLQKECRTVVWLTICIDSAEKDTIDLAAQCEITISDNGRSQDRFWLTVGYKVDGVALRQLTGKSLDMK